MPFDVLPQQTEVEVGPFQEFADALMRGAAMTLPAPPMEALRLDERGCPTHACAYYAIRFGMGPDNAFYKDQNLVKYERAKEAYYAKYGRSIVEDYEVFGQTREQIAARIAALR